MFFVNFFVNKNRFSKSLNNFKLFYVSALLETFVLLTHFRCKRLEK